MECGHQCVVVNMTTILQLLSADSLDTTILKVHLKEHCSTILANTIKNAKIQRNFLHILDMKVLLRDPRFSEKVCSYKGLTTVTISSAAGRG